MTKTSFTSESVCAGHPDKICDQISDAVVDAALTIDPFARVAIETLVTENHISLAGEVSARGEIEYEKIARDVIKKLGYTHKALKFTHQSPVHIFIHTQSPEIAVGVDDMGAGDQGMMFGYATVETEQLMPMPIQLAHSLVQRLDEMREKKILPYLRPDGKAQVTVTYENTKAVAVEKVVLAAPHNKSVDLKTVKEDLFKKVVLPVLKSYRLKISKKNVIVNGTGVWHFSGPAADTGVTGRKIIVDTYGGMARVGGGAFSGKDPTKVDRSGAYAARFLAKNIVSAGLADRCEVLLAYCIGERKPVMQEIETFGTEKKARRVIVDFMNGLLDTSVSGILDALNLRRPLYFKTASYGHFGRSEFPWEKITV